MKWQSVEYREEGKDKRGRQKIERKENGEDGQHKRDWIGGGEGEKSRDIECLERMPTRWEEHSAFVSLGIMQVINREEPVLSLVILPYSS